MTETPKKTLFRVTSYGTDDRVISRYNVEAETVKLALDSAHTIARSWNRDEHRPNMIVKRVETMGTVQEVIQPATIRNALIEK